MLLPIAIRKESNTITQSPIVLAADIGATKTNLAIFKVEAGQLVLLQEQQFKSKEYKNFTQITDIFLSELPLPDSVCFAVAGPVLNGHAKLSNINWEIGAEELANHIGVKNIHLINDLEATAFGLAELQVHDIAVICKGSKTAFGNAAVIAPGTGLGEAGLFWDGKYFHPFATEGGHCDFAPRNEFDFELYAFLQKKFGHVSWERLVCGPGIVNIYQFLRDEKKSEEPVWLNEKIKNGDAAAVINAHVSDTEICRETMELFTTYLARESANLALKFKATGGLFIGGGIAPQIVSLLQSKTFTSSFYSSGRLNYLLDEIPVKIILNTNTALSGAAFFAANN